MIVPNFNAFMTSLSTLNCLEEFFYTLRTFESGGNLVAIKIQIPDEL